LASIGDYCHEEEVTPSGGCGEWSKTSPMGRNTRRGRVVLKSRGHFLFLQPEAIEWVAAHHNYVRLHVGAASHLVRGTISSFERWLGPSEFLRIHRSTIVNISSISKVEPLKTGDFKVRLKSGKQLVLSRGYRDKLRQLLDSLMTYKG
jgi:two-component system LytT family response regulator